MNYIVSFESNSNPDKQPQGSRKSLYLHQLIKSFDNKIVDFQQMISAFAHIRSEIDNLDKKYKCFKPVYIRLLNDRESKNHTLMIFFEFGYYRAKLKFKRID